MKMAEGGFRPAYNVQFATIDILALVPKPKNPGRDPYKPLPGDAPGVADWRTRMGTEAAKQAYTQRAATAECVNALARQRGLQQLPVRGQRKAYAIALWFALAHNLRRALSLRPELALGAA